MNQFRAPDSGVEEEQYIYLVHYNYMSREGNSTGISSWNTLSTGSGWAYLSVQYPPSRGEVAVLYWTSIEISVDLVHIVTYAKFHTSSTIVLS